MHPRRPPAPQIFCRDGASPAHRGPKRAILYQVVPVSTPFLLGLVFAGGVAIWYLRVRSARDSKRASAASRARNSAMRSAQSVEAAIRGRR
jgi:hypothetical protein